MSLGFGRDVVINLSFDILNSVILPSDLSSLLSNPSRITFPPYLCLPLSLSLSHPPSHPWRRARRPCQHSWPSQLHHTLSPSSTNLTDLRSPHLPSVPLPLTLFFNSHSSLPHILSINSHSLPKSSALRRNEPHQLQASLPRPGFQSTSPSPTKF